MKIAVTGASGLIGSALVPALRADGHEVVRLVRRASHAVDEASWDPAAGTVDDAALTGADAVVHLAGAGIADKRWNDAHKKAVLDSRVQGTTTIAAAVARMPTPAVLLSGSAVGFYGDRGDTVLTEAADSGEGFLADVCRQWEAATAAADEAGGRVVHLRTGLVLSADGGLLKKTLPLFKLGVAGRLGSGEQYMPWISLADEIGAIRHLLTTEVSGPVNLSGPEPVTNGEYTKTLATHLHRPAVLPVPAFALRIVLDGFADEGALVSQRMVPSVLQASGYTFAHPTLAAAFAGVL